MNTLFKLGSIADFADRNGYHEIASDCTQLLKNAQIFDALSTLLNPSESELGDDAGFWKRLTRGWKSGKFDKRLGLALAINEEREKVNKRILELAEPLKTFSDQISSFYNKVRSGGDNYSALDFKSELSQLKSELSKMKMLIAGRPIYKLLDQRNRLNQQQVSAIDKIKGIDPEKKAILIKLLKGENILPQNVEQLASNTSPTAANSNSTTAVTPTLSTNEPEREEVELTKQQLQRRELRQSEEIGVWLRNKGFGRGSDLSEGLKSNYPWMFRNFNKAFGLSPVVVLREIKNNKEFAAELHETFGASAYANVYHWATNAVRKDQEAFDKDIVSPGAGAEVRPAEDPRLEQISSIQPGSMSADEIRKIVREETRSNNTSSSVVREPTPSNAGNNPASVAPINSDQLPSVTRQPSIPELAKALLPENITSAPAALTSTQSDVTNPLNDPKNRSERDIELAKDIARVTPSKRKRPGGVAKERAVSPAEPEKIQPHIEPLGTFPVQAPPSNKADDLSLVSSATMRTERQIVRLARVRKLNSFKFAADEMLDVDKLDSTDTAEDYINSYKVRAHGNETISDSPQDIMNAMKNGREPLDEENYFDPEDLEYFKGRTHGEDLNEDYDMRRDPELSPEDDDYDPPRNEPIRHAKEKNELLEELGDELRTVQKSLMSPLYSKDNEFSEYYRKNDLERRKKLLIKKIKDLSGLPENWIRTSSIK